MKPNSHLQEAYFASGCFWGTQYHFDKIHGVVSTEVGYMGGSVKNPSYPEVKTGTTGHVETVKVVYDPEKVTYEQLVRLYYETHDFEQEGGHGPDIGPQYRSVIFYVNDEQRTVAENYKQILTEQGYKVATALEPASTFWREQEEYHHHYYDKNGHTPYCHIYRKIFD
ncbi:MAG: peptide-methionine (S)-S-oxide reductase MsrA [Tannerellaceae bacterium]|nr:peptide-methionine (S)-S-oxide reductase MsrA [Tannerellaceae bacterium]